MCAYSPAWRAFNDNIRALKPSSTKLKLNDTRYIRTVCMLYCAISLSFFIIPTEFGFLRHGLAPLSPKKTNLFSPFLIWSPRPFNDILSPRSLSPSSATLTACLHVEEPSHNSFPTVRLNTQKKVGPGLKDGSKDRVICRLSPFSR